MQIHLAPVSNWTPIEKSIPSHFLYNSCRWVYIMGQHQYLILWLWMLHMFQLKNCFVLQDTQVRGSDPKEEDWKDQIANRPPTLKIVFFLQVT